MSNEFIVPTGKIIKEYLDESHINQKELSVRLGMSEKHISNLLNGKSRLTEEVALKFETIFKDIPASYWLNLESKYREFLARQNATHKLEDLNLVEIAEKFRFKEVFKGLGWNIQKQANEMLKLLKISAFENFYATYSDLATDFMEDGGNLESMVVWLKLCEEEIYIQNSSLETIKYNHSALEETLPLFKKLALSDSSSAISKNSRRLCNKLGIYLVFCPAITNCKIRGALTTYNDHPTIYLSGRFKTHDHIWFALMHEIGHLLEHYNSKDTFISYDDDQNDSSIQIKEEEANIFARDFFINPIAYVNFVSSHIFDERTIRAFATSQKILPGIVVARLQHDDYLTKSQLNYLKTKMELFEYLEL